MVQQTQKLEKSSLELIQEIKLNRDPANRKNAETAFNTFCFRFEEPLKKIVERSCRGYGLTSNDAIEVLELTFKRFWQYPKFEAHKIKSSDTEKGIILYLARIAQRALIDLIKLKSGSKYSPYDGDEQIVHEFPKISNPKLINDENYLIINEVLNNLSWKHKVIYLTYSSYEHKGFKLPRKLLADLRTDLQLSQSTIRSYRFEVVKKIEEYRNLWRLKN